MSMVYLFYFNQLHNQLAGCYLFTVSNWGLLFSHGRLVSPDVHIKPEKKRFYHVTVNIYLWPVVLTFKPDTDRDKTNQRVKYLHSEP